MYPITPNWFATIALLAWPFVGLYLYATRPLTQATLWTILGAYLLLPVGTAIKLEGVPALDKTSIPNLVALLGCFITARGLRFWYRPGVAEGLILLFLVGPFITSNLNSDTIVIAEKILPGVGAYDALSASVTQFIFFAPYVLGRQLFRKEKNTEDLLRALVIAGLAYSLPMLFEVRMSPQLHIWIYGYFPHGFDQQFRAGGFRPVVFMGHGLLVAFFTATIVIAAAALLRGRMQVGRFPIAWVTGFLGGLLLLCKSMGPLLYALVLAPLVRWAKPKTQLRVAAVLVSFALMYPVLRMADLVPTASLLSAAEMVSTERAESLATRFEQEKILLDHAKERFWFGWGRFGRSRIYAEDSGKDISVTDGGWIIQLGTFGFIGFLAEFGLLAFPVFRAASSLRFAQSTQEALFLATLALIVAVNLFDLVPNASISPWTWLLAGALLGRAESLHGKEHHPDRPWRTAGTRTTN